MVPEEENIKDKHKWSFPWVQFLLQICWLYLRAEEHNEHCETLPPEEFKQFFALGELQGFCHFAFPRQVSQICTSSCLAPDYLGNQKRLSSWQDQESSVSYLPLILKFILQIPVAMESCLEWLPWTLLSLPLKKFPSHLSVCPPQLVSACWVSLFGPVLLKQVHTGAAPRLLAHQGKAHGYKHTVEN